MATIPLIQDSAQLQTSTGRQRIGADANAFGGQEAQGLDRIAGGLNKVADVAQDLDDDFNEADAGERDAELSAGIRDILYNPESGYLHQRSRNAADRRIEVEAQVDRLAADIGTRARNPRAGAMYLQVARRRVADALGDIAAHSARELVTYNNEVSESRLTEFRDNAVAAFADPAAVAAQMDGAVSEIQRLGARNGWDSSVTNQRIRQFQSDIGSRVVVQLATTDPSAAEEMYQRIRPSLSAQDAGELLTSMRSAQRAALERVEGMAWQAFASGQSLQQGMGPEAYREFTTNPLYGQSRVQIQNAMRERQRAYAAGAGPRDNSPAYRALVLEENLRPDRYVEPGRLEAFIEQNAHVLSTGDIERAFASRRALREGGGGSDANALSTRFNAVRNISTAALRPYGIDLSDSESSETRAFEAALLRAVQQSTPEENPQVIIGRAVVGMSASDVRDLPQFRVRGNSGRDARAGVTATTEAVVPYDAIDPVAARRIGTRLQELFGRRPTRGEVENAYAAYLTDAPLIPRSVAPRWNEGSGIPRAAYEIGRMVERTRDDE